MPAYSSLYSNFIRSGSSFAKSATAHGYAQSVVAATHPHLLNSQNRPAFTRRHTNRLGRPSLQLHSSAFHTEKNAPSLIFSDHRHVQNHGGLDGYFENLQQIQEATGEEVDKEWTQYEFPKRIEWKPSSDSVALTGEQAVAAAAEAENAATLALELEPRPMTPEEQAALAHIDAALQREIEFREQLEAAENEPLPRSRTATPGSIARSATPVDPQSQSYADHLSKLANAGRYAEIPAVFEAMLEMEVRPIATAYNALLKAAIHLPTKKLDVTSKPLDVYADMLRRRVTPDAQTYDILVGFLASRSLDVSQLIATLEAKRHRFGGMEEPGKFMLASHELEHAFLSEDDRLDFAMKLFDSSVATDADMYSSTTYKNIINACASAGRVADMIRLFEHMESTHTAPHAEVFPSMINAFAQSGDLVNAVECYNEYRALAISSDAGTDALLERLDAEVYAAVIHAYVVSDKIEGAMKFFQKLVQEYGVRAVDIKNVLVSQGFVKGFIARGIFEEAIYWTQSIEATSRTKALAEIVAITADQGDHAVATEAYACIPSGTDRVAPSTAMLAMSIRSGDVASASKYWNVLCEAPADASLIDPTAMYAVAMIGSGQVVEGLSEAEKMFGKLRAADAQLAEPLDEAIKFIGQYMAVRGIIDPREVPSPVSSLQQQSLTSSSPFMSSETTASYEDTFDPYAHSTDFKGSSLIADDLEGSHGRKGPRMSDALHRLKNMRRAGRHPRYITYAKLITAAARDGKMELCQDILAMARADVPLMPQYAVVRYGWSSILDAMVGACLNLGNRGRAEQYHQELLDMGSAPSANTFGLYITTLKESTKTFDEASEAVRIFHRAKAEGVEASSFLYNALIGKLGKARRIDDCLFYFAEMRALGIKPTSVTYGTVVNALCRVSDEKFAEELFDEMEAMPNYKARPAPYNSMMQFFLTTKRDKSKVLSYFDRMQARGIAPTSHTYKLLVDTYATLEPVDMEAAEEVLAKIRAAGQRPEPVHFASLIHARGCVLHDMPGARKMFDSIISEKLVPMNASLYQALFEAMVANHNVADTESVLEHMRSQRIQITPYIANTLIHGWAAAKNISKAQSIYDAVGREKREPSTYEAMTRAYLALDQRDQAKGVVGEMLTRGYPSAVVNKVLELLGGGHEAPPS